MATGDDAGTGTGTDGAQNIRINVKAMNTGQGFEIIYYSEIPSVARVQNCRE